MSKNLNQSLLSRRSVIVAGLIGLVGAVFLTALCLLVMVQGWIPVLINHSRLGWGVFLFLVLFSVAEIPLMVYSIRRIAESNNPKARYVALLATTGYCFFGAVYAAPFILLTGRLALGTLMATLSFARFVSALVFLPR